MPLSDAHQLYTYKCIWAWTWLDSKTFFFLGTEEPGNPEFAPGMNSSTGWVLRLNQACCEAVLAVASAVGCQFHLWNPVWGNSSPLLPMLSAMLPALCRNKLCSCTQAQTSQSCIVYCMDYAPAGAAGYSSKNSHLSVQNSSLPWRILTSKWTQSCRHVIWSLTSCWCVGRSTTNGKARRTTGNEHEAFDKLWQLSFKHSAPINLGSQSLPL